MSTALTTRKVTPRGFFGSPLMDQFFDSFMESTPPDYTETEDAYQITIDVPGIDPKDITIEMDKDLLTIKGETGNRKVHRAYRVSSFVGIENVEATSKHGVLTVTLRKPEQLKPRKIEVKLE